MKRTISLFTLCFILFFTFSSYADNLLDYPPIPSNESGDFFITVKSGVTYLKYFSDSIAYEDGYKLSGSGTVTFKPFSRYILSSDGSTWKYDPSSYNGSWIGNLIYSSANIYNSDGTVFFSLPKGITEVIQEETGKILPVLVGQIQTILPTGFGVLSLMLSTILLVVYFLRYQRRFG